MDNPIVCYDHVDPSPIQNLNYSKFSQGLRLNWDLPDGILDAIELICQPACYGDKSKIILKPDTTEVLIKSLQWGETYSFSLYTFSKGRDSDWVTRIIQAG